MPFALDPNIAAIIRYGKKHPQYNRAVRIYEQQKYQYDVGQQREHAQDRARAELQRRAQSGEIDESQRHGWSMAESAAMAPILAKRKAEEKHAEEQRRKEIGQKNPYKLKLEDDKSSVEGLEARDLGTGRTEYFKNEGDRKVRVDPERDKGFDNEYFRQKRIADGSYGAGLAIPQELRDQAKRYVAYKDKQREGIASKAELIDSVNDPYNRIQADRAREQHATLKEQYAIQKDAQAKRDAAAAEIAKEYMESPSQYESNHGKPAADAAGKIARSYLDQKFRKAGYNGVPLGGDIFDPEGKMGAPGTPAATGQTAGQTQGSASRPATVTTGQPAAQAASASTSPTAENYINGGEGVRSGTGTTMSQPVTKPQVSAAPATPQGPTYDPSKKYDHIKHAQWIMSLPEEERKRQIATMDDFQKDFVEKSIDSVKHYDKAIKNVDDTMDYWKKYDQGLEERGMLGYERALAKSRWYEEPVAKYTDNVFQKPPPGWGGTEQPTAPVSVEKQPAPSYPAYSVPPVEATTAGERASQAVQSSVIPRRSNEPSPDWGIAYDAAKEALTGPVKAMADTTPGANIIAPPSSAARQLWNNFTDPYGLKGRPSDAPVDSADIPPLDGSEDEKDPAVIARRLLNTPSAQY